MTSTQLSLAVAAILAAHLSAVEAADPPACSHLTPLAYDTLTSRIQVALADAQADCALFCVTGAYASAPAAVRDYMQQMLDNTQQSKAWLDGLSMFNPYVSNAAGAYEIHRLARDNIYALHVARHWATISAGYHKSSNAYNAYGDISSVITQLETMGEYAGRCYVEQAAPFTN